jgi:hypothetical protein
MMDIYLPGIQAVMNGIAPETAIQAIEQSDSQILEEAQS